MARFRANRNLSRELAGKPAMRAALKDAAGDAAESVSQLARQMSEDPIMPKGTGDLAVVEVDGREVRVVLRGHGAHIAEFGSVHNPAYAPLRRGIRAAGLGLRESSK